MSFVEVIARKRDGQALSREEIAAFVSAAAEERLPDYQTSALLMAVVLRGLSEDELWWLTEAMVRSGERVDLTDVPGNTVGKHSTGGVGDKVSIALAPLAAACGVIVPKMSGRGLGHTGGTLDKLQSIPGFRTNLSIPEFKQVLRDVGTCIIGQTAALVPADRKLYALRDVTATVESIPLIAASVMSKKLAEGSSALVLDVKCGAGAFMKHEQDARTLGAAMVQLGERAGVPTEAVITAMDAPLGRAVGNGVEVAECIDVLKGRGPADLTDLVLALASRMLVLAGVAPHADAADAAVRGMLAAGHGLERLRRMVAAQGGDPRVIDDPQRLPSGRAQAAVRAARSGWVVSLDAGLVGRAAAALGAGRERVEDSIDHGAGILVRTRVGDRVSAGDVLLELLYNDPARLARAMTLAEAAVRLEDDPIRSGPLIIGSVRSDTARGVRIRS